MENRKSISNVRALREKFELQAEENRSRCSTSGQQLGFATNFGSQTKLSTQTGSLHLSDAMAPDPGSTLSSSPLTASKPRLSVPIPPSVLPTQVLKPRPRPFSYSEATSGSGSSFERDMLQAIVVSPPAPEKPPRTFLYDLLSDPPLPQQQQQQQPQLFSPQSDPHPIYSGVSLRRRTALTATASLPRSGDMDLENGNERSTQSVPVHRKAIYVSDGPFTVTKRKKKTKTIRTFLLPGNGDSCEEFDHWNRTTENSNSNDVKYLSATKEMHRLLDKQSQAAPRISKASIRPIQVSSGTGQGHVVKSGSLSPPRLMRAKTESDILSSISSRPWKAIGVPVCDSSDYGSIQGESDHGDRGSMRSNQSSLRIKNYLNPYYYPNGLIVGADGKLCRQPITPDHPNHYAVGVLQNFEQFFDAGSTSRAADKYLEFVRRFHPELEHSAEPALFYRQGTSVTVVPSSQKATYLFKLRSTYSSPYQAYCIPTTVLSPELGIWRNPTMSIAGGPRPVRASELSLKSGAKSKSEWDLNDAVHNDVRRHSTQQFVSTSHYHDNRNRTLGQENAWNNNRLPSGSTIQQSIHSLVNQIYPVTIDSAVAKDATSSTDSGIQLGTDSLSSCDTPLTGDSTTEDTGDSDCENDTENLEAIRQVVEERKGYIRRVSSIRTELLPLQRLLRNRPLPETLPSTIEPGNEHGVRALFDNLLVIGIRRDEKTGAYHPIIKYKFPHSTVLPDGIERFCFPDSKEWPCHEGTTAQFYTLTLTQSDGSRKYGCCYRILPDGANICIPIAYCIITRTRAIGFYRRVLQLLAARHGYCEAQMNYMINELYNEEVPDPGKNLVLKDPTAMLSNSTSCIDYGLTVPVLIRRKADPRLENNDLYLLLTTVDLPIALKLFGSLLLERKIILISRHLNLLSLCVEALESMLYPFSWQHTFVPILPLNMIELLELPAPFVIGVLRSQEVVWEIKLDEGIVVDLDQKKILHSVTDEGSILPKRLYKKLREALQSVINLVDQTENTRNVLISECFIRMFVESVGHYKASGTFQSLFYQNSEDMTPEMRVFKKEMFLKSISSKSNRDFLDWFSETSMFQQFIESRKLPDFKPGLFEQRCTEQLQLNKEPSQPNGANVPWKHPSILSKGTAWIKGAFHKERD